MFSVVMSVKEKQYQFPKSRFFTYESSDRDWREYCGIGEEIDVLETVTIPNARLSVTNGGVDIIGVASPSMTGASPV